MGEELKKPEEKKPEGEEKKKVDEAPKPAEEGKTEEKKSDDPKAAEEKQPPPPPPLPQEIVLKVFMHCEGCARKVRRCLKGFPGVDEVMTDCKTSKVVVKGEKAEPLKVLERIQRKSHRQVLLISPIPIPNPPAQDPQQKMVEVKNEEQEQEQEIPVITVVLGVYMHCEACAQEIKKRILKMKGVEIAEPEIKSSQVTVKGKFEPEKLVDYVYKRTGKHAVIVKAEPEKKDDEKDEKEEKKEEEKEAIKDEKVAEEKKEEGGGAVEPPAKPAAEDDLKMEVKKNESYYYYYPENHQVDDPRRFVQEYYDAYPPQIFSDENPNACTVM